MKQDLGSSSWSDRWKQPNQSGHWLALGIIDMGMCLGKDLESGFGCNSRLPGFISDRSDGQNMDFGSSSFEEMNNVVEITEIGPLAW